MRSTELTRATKLWMAGIGAAALVAGPLSGVASAAPTPIYVDNLMGTSTDPTCTAAILTHSTIQSAVADANSGDTIVVCPSTYPENVSDGGKALTFQSMTALGATVNGGGGTAFTLSGTGSSLDGFMLVGATNVTDTPAAFLQGNGEQVTNNTFSGDSNGATITGNNALFQGNIVKNPNTAGSAGAAGFFFNSGGGSNSTVTGNSFVGDFDDSAINIADLGPIANNLTITGNTADNTAGGNFVVAGGTTGLVVQGNSVTGSSSSGSGILLLGGDTGYSITGNTVGGRTNASAVSIAGGFGYPVNGGGDVSTNSFKGNKRGINVTDASGTITAHLNIFVGNSEAAINNATTAPDTAVVSDANNFFGCNGGPGANGCDGTEGTVNSAPYLVLSTSVVQSSIAVGGSTTLTADLNHNSAGTTVSGHVLDKAESAAFTFTGGTASPSPVPFLGGNATTLLTAGSTSGTFSATATVENAMSSTPVTITGGSTGGKPSIKIIDANTVEGNSGTHPINFPVRLSKAAPATVTVHYQTADGSAKAGSDYIAKSGTLTIAKGAKSGTISVLVKGDKVKEPSETFFVTLSNATNASIADPNASGVIKNDD